MLRLCALCKQGTGGDAKGDKPGFFDFVGAAKHEARTRLKGTPPEDARKQCVEPARKLKR